jgi:hypothetical protein
MGSCGATLLSIMKDVLLLVIGGLIGFFFSYTQWKLALTRAKRDKHREKLEQLHEDLHRFAELVRYTIHKHHCPGKYYPEVGPDPMPHILMLKNLYAPEIAETLRELRKLYSETVESQVCPDLAAFDPIQAKVAEIQKVVRAKIDRLE